MYESGGSPEEAADYERVGYFKEFIFEGSISRFAGRRDNALIEALGLKENEKGLWVK